MKLSYLRISNLVLIILLSISTLSCKNSVSGEEHEHPEADGFRLMMNGEVIVEELPHQEINGEIELHVGEETSLITIYFLDHDGEEFQPEESENTLTYEFSNEGIARFEQHTEDGKWSFHLHAEAEGLTDLTLKLMHGTHSDFSTSPISITVNPEVN